MLYSKDELRCIKDLIRKSKTIKLLEEYLCNLWIRMDFLPYTKSKFDRFKYIKDSYTIVKSTDNWHTGKIKPPRDYSPKYTGNSGYQ